ncbi:IS1182 family transposase [Thermaerobacter composti]|uniref:IS1182 family transposase n=1 Tax=Thermaerobacter composti TaxID=554949 RepID=A0ABZ0QPM0_9FIRM|nr:IS1182 family transposase [Thermaerobacter composti]WPD18348.1 IS1182 family transposase [Thermaerobacter composti]
MAYNLRPVNRDQLYLLPPSLRDWLPEDHLAWFLIDAVEPMDLRAFYEKYRADGWGGESYDPTMMVTLLLYAYCVGERSSRRIERLCLEDVAFRVITANQKPDHVTIARFRQRHARELAALFTQVLRLCREAGLGKVGVVALDGTKVKANASLAANRTYDAIRQEVEKMLREAEATDREEDERYGPGRRGDALPEELRSRQSRLERLKACKRRLEEEAAREAARLQARIEERKAQEQATGKKRRGRKPKAPDASVDPAAKANVTDPDSRILKTRQGFVQGYNAQAVVTEDQLIVAAAVTQDANDVGQLHPMLQQAQANLRAAGVNKPIRAVVADAGYWSEANVKQAPADGPELFLATSKEWKHRQAVKDAPPPRGRIPKGLSLRERMERKLRTRRGQAIYAKRSQTVEPVFGQIKTVRGADRFLRRGLAACDSEWKLLCLTHNLLKLWRKVTKGSASSPFGWMAAALA